MEIPVLINQTKMAYFIDSHFFQDEAKSCIHMLISNVSGQLVVLLYNVEMYMLLCDPASVYHLCVIFVPG